MHKQGLLSVRQSSHSASLQSRVSVYSAFPCFIMCWATATISVQQGAVAISEAVYF